jgi:hypothetical protein
MLALTLSDYKTRPHDMRPGQGRLTQPAPSHYLSV